MSKIILFAKFVLLISFLETTATTTTTTTNDVTTSQKTKVPIDFKLNLVAKFLNFDISSIATQRSNNFLYTIYYLENWQLKNFAPKLSKNLTGIGRNFEDETLIFFNKRSGANNAENQTNVIVLEIMDFPGSIQKHFLMDVTKVIDRSEQDGQYKNTLTIQNEDYTLKMIAKTWHPEIHLSPDAVRDETCHCQNYACSCCVHANMPKIKLNHTVCANITYLVQDFGLKIIIAIDNYIIFTDEVSARNPPPICEAVPYLEQFASVCLVFYNVSFTDHHYGACMELEGKAYHLPVGKIKLGCFYFAGGNNNNRQIEAEVGGVAPKKINKQEEPSGTIYETII